MEEYTIQEAADRIRQMELHFDVLKKAANVNAVELQEDTSLKELLHKLIQYYESGQWLHDYELDEKGLLPQNLKRGVLAQDSVYDFLSQIQCVDRKE